MPVTTPVGNCLGADMPPHENGEPEKSSITRDNPGNTQSSCIFMELQEADNISKATYKELMAIAVEAKTWIVSTPALGSLEEFLQMFQDPMFDTLFQNRALEMARPSFRTSSCTKKSQSVANIINDFSFFFEGNHIVDL